MRVPRSLIEKEIHEWANHVDWRHTDVVVCSHLLDVAPWEILWQYRRDLPIILYEPTKHIDAIELVRPHWMDTGHGASWHDGVPGVSVAGHLTDLRVVVEQVVKLGQRVEHIWDPSTPETDGRVTTAISEGVRERLLREHTSRFHSRQWLDTALSTLPSWCGCPILPSIWGKIKGIPAVVIGAGPSLDADLDTLREIQHHTLLVAVNSAVGPLSDAGITPHIVCAVEASDVSIAPVIDLPAWTGSYTVLGSHCHPSAWEGYTKGRILAWQAAGAVGSGLVRRVGLPPIATGGSVSTMAYRVAENLTDGPIALVGMDGCYHDGRLYARGVRHDGYHPMCPTPAPALAWGGIGKVQCPPDFVSYRAWWDDVAHRGVQLERPVTNCSRYGARIEHTVEKKLYEWVRDLGLPVEPVEEILDEVVAASTVLSHGLVVEMLEEEITEGDILAAETGRGAAAAREALAVWVGLAAPERRADFLGGAAVSSVEEHMRLPTGDHLQSLADLMGRTSEVWPLLRNRIRSCIVEIRGGQSVDS